ncbi:neuronal acetylcholine receptor subunit alpha-7-like [Dreissena polymorpha]|uniref:neuronal acetylcholine receptor subunit alpha-7-like n=1 Tax=Dreissena polymorpha TaxID=45954 RepID=UPI002264F115|nr:neuronal acetylcholine receptor subunit alpha-7-like [Dreissena polymorpha]
MTSFNGVPAKTVTDAERLFSDLMVGYSKMFRPVLNESIQVVVSIWMDLVSIQDFNEVEEKISFTALLYLAWQDKRLVWDPKDYGGIDNLYIDVSKIWVPQMMLMNNVNKNERLSEDWHTVKVNASGICVYYTGNVFTSSCNVDVTFYPWDTQTCSLNFMPANYGFDKMSLYPLYHKVELTYYSPNGAWDLMDTSVTSEIYSFMVNFNVVLERKPRFAIVNVLLPLIIMSALNILVFLIPTECGERISFCLTVLLSIAVFLTLVGDNLPKNSNPMSLFSSYLVSVLVISVAITLAVICSLHVYHISEKQQPGGAWRAIAMCLGCYCVRRAGSESADRTYRSDEIKGQDYSAKGVLTIFKEIFFPLLAPSSAFMAALDVTCRRRHPRDGFPSALCVLSTVAPGSLSKATPRFSWDHINMGRRPAPCPPRMTSTLVISLSHCSRPSSDGTSCRSGPAHSRR